LGFMYNIDYSSGIYIVRIDRTIRDSSSGIGIRNYSSMTSTSTVYEW
jgi:hypothetical protein